MTTSGECKAKVYKTPREGKGKGRGRGREGEGEGKGSGRENSHTQTFNLEAFKQRGQSAEQVKGKTLQSSQQ